MRKLLYLLAIAALLPTAAYAQVKVSSLPGASTITGTEKVPIVQSAVTKAATPEQLRVYDAKTKQGMINVRTIYGAVPDGSTDNSTVIASAFAAANAYAANPYTAATAPTVYFDCDSSSTTCIYNYGGSGTSPIHPTIPMNIVCAPGATLNYTGTAHAADIGGSLTLTVPMSKRMSITGCRWTGGGSMTAGIYYNDYVETIQIHNNEFISFGQANTFAIVLSNNNWDSDISNNVWHDLDGTVRGVLDAHTAQNANIHFVNNKADCLTTAALACPIPTAGNGIGLWINTGFVAFNQILGHYPAIRLSSCSVGGCGGGVGNFIAFNSIEGNTGGTMPAISYGDPGGTAANIAHWHINYNNFYWPTTGSVSWVGPETPASGSYSLQANEFVGNTFSGTPNGTTPYLKVGSSGNYVSGNTNAAGPVTQSTTTPLLDTGFAANNAYFAIDSFKGNGTNLTNSIPVGDSTGVHMSAAMFHNLATPLTCPDVSASGTAQSCVTTPRFDISGSSLSPVAGDMILYKTTTTNTGALTVAVNGASAAPVYKSSTNTAVASGDVIAGIYHLLTFNGTNWYMVGR